MDLAVYGLDGSAVGSGVVDTTAGVSSDELYQSEWKIDEYEPNIIRYMDFPPLQSMDGVYDYFRRTGFKCYDLVLHIVEMDRLLEYKLREYFVDFRDLSFPAQRPADRPYLRMRVRSHSLRCVMALGISWEDLYIGFQARFFVEPDVYHLRWFNHFILQVAFPTTPCWPELVSW